MFDSILLEGTNTWPIRSYQKLLQFFCLTQTFSLSSFPSKKVSKKIYFNELLIRELNARKAIFVYRIKFSTFAKNSSNYCCSAILNYSSYTAKLSLKFVPLAL